MRANVVRMVVTTALSVCGPQLQTRGATLAPASPDQRGHGCWCIGGRHRTGESSGPWAAA